VTEAVVHCHGCASVMKYCKCWFCRASLDYIGEVYFSAWRHSTGDVLQVLSSYFILLKIYVDRG